MRRPSLLGSALLALTLGACADQPAPLAPLTLADARASFELAEAGPDHRPFGLVGLGEVFDLGARAIDPSDYTCSSNTPLVAWLTGTINSSIAAEELRFITAFSHRAAEIPTYEALFFQSSKVTPQYYGKDGRHTHTINKAVRDLKRFCAIQSADIDVVAMHGDVLIDTLRTARTYQLLGYSAAQSKTFARTLRSAIVGSTTMVDGDHPAFTFNAAALIGFGATPLKKIVVGDGVLLGYDAMGFGDVAPAAIFAHEFAHHVQFEKGYQPPGASLTPAERTRFSELGADAMAAYWMTHARGMAMSQRRVEQFAGIFFQTGDCAFSSATHHGTPNQRMKATRLGFQIADDELKQGRILSPDQFQAKFVAAYGSLIAPDAN